MRNNAILLKQIIEQQDKTYKFLKELQIKITR